MTQTQTVDGGSGKGGPVRSSSVEALLRRHDDAEPLTAGAVVKELLEAHRDYLDEGVGPRDAAAVGPSRTVAEHVDIAERRWDPALAPKLTGRHVVLALAMDEGVGWRLLQSGAIASLLARWRPGKGTAEEPHRLVWDVLSDDGRARADDQPLLAAALGAPAEWSVELPAPASALAWSPAGDHVAILAGGMVYEAAPHRPLSRVNDVDEHVVSLGWGQRDGVVALHVEDGMAQVTRVSTRSFLGDWSGATGGRLSADGSRAWLELTDQVARWSPQQPPPVRLAPVAKVLAVGGTGREGLLATSGNSILVAGVPGDVVPGAGEGVGSPPDWPSDAAPMIGWGPIRTGPCALVTLGQRIAVAAAAREGVVIEDLPFPPVARVATGPGRITALATDVSGTRLAVAIGDQVRIWTLSVGRPAARSIPGYDSDRPAERDLLDADRDANALAALIASRDLRPPLAIGLFGAWGSGKSFMLGRIASMLAGLTGPSAPDGYLDHITVVRFNAWHYAETNLWASLVDQVLRAIGPAELPEVAPEVEDAVRRAEEAEGRRREVDAQVVAARSALEAARKKLVTRRRNAWRLGTGVLLLAAVAVVAAVLGGPGRVVAGVSTALALLGSAYAAYDQARRASDQGAELVGAGRAGIGALSRLAGRPEELAVRAAAADLQSHVDAQDVAVAEAGRLRVEAERVQELAAREPLGTLLHRLATVTEYRDQLSLVARTRERFNSINAAVTLAREHRAEGVEDAEHDLQLDRVVIAIDDLDRCPAENVVKVLEAVHLLFDFEMFVVVLAVDTRWLDQSLRIRYRQLLGQAGTAAPSDYLEKIIQVPVHLLPLDEGLVRGMIAGLTGRSLAAAEPEVPVDGAQPPHEPAPSQPQNGALQAERGRAPRPPLPAEVLKISQEEATALAAVAPLVGTTPRTVKRFVNTYRLLKARAPDPSLFDHPEDSLGDHEVVAFLLAVLTGRPAAARHVLPALAGAAAHATLAGTLEPAPDSATGEESATGDTQQALADVRAWLARHPRYGQAPARRFAKWAQEVARFSFTPPAANGGLEQPGM